MKRTVFYGAALLGLLSSCQKVVDIIADKGATTTTTATASFTQYIIPSGQHYADKSGYKPVDIEEMKFAVRFDSSAIYQTILAENQWDINKLYGFSDNNTDHHQYSARFGWNWREGALRLHAYVYNKGVVESRELTTVAIGAETVCSIRVTGGAYLFSVDGKMLAALPRQSASERGKGYQLYPYFGGDETAPHDIRIGVKNL
jgi:hypothetical protein